ncbi:manganese catalase family protein [Rhodobacter sp. NSM]|uniref:manganese catalase family protein n=1 Tax=Rhodobacter sp. NSM TaxID=3457501 RepID=UPI003FCF5421
MTSAAALPPTLSANVTAESAGRLLATRLHTMTADPEMKELLACVIARDCG